MMLKIHLKTNLNKAHWVEWRLFLRSQISVCLCVQRQVNVIVQGSDVQPTATLCCCITVVTVQEVCKDYNLIYRRRSNTEILSTQSSIWCIHTPSHAQYSTTVYHNTIGKKQIKYDPQYSKSSRTTHKKACLFIPKSLQFVWKRRRNCVNHGI